jgi:hypothetical protein
MNVDNSRALHTKYLRDFLVVYSLSCGVSTPFSTSRLLDMAVEYTVFTNRRQGSLVYGQTSTAVRPSREFDPAVLGGNFETGSLEHGQRIS